MDGKEKARTKRKKQTWVMCGRQRWGRERKAKQADARQRASQLDEVCVCDENAPGRSCLRCGRISSLNSCPQIDSPPVPLPLGSPP